MVCIHCNSDNSTGSRFCKTCLSPLEQPKQTKQQTNRTNQTKTLPKSMNTNPPSTFEWLKLFILLTIPPINIIIAILLASGGTKSQIKQNFAQAYITYITITLALILAVGFNSTKILSTLNSVPQVVTETKVNFQREFNLPLETTPTPSPTQEFTQPQTVSKNDNIVTKQEFNQVLEGITPEQLFAIVGGSGQKILDTGLKDTPYTLTIYSYEGKGTVGANANFSFINGKLQSKEEFGLQ